MVNSDDFKSKIVSLISQDYEIKFLGKNFDKIVGFLSETKAEKIYVWINDVVNEQFQPILIASKKPYKDWEVKQLLTFRYPFSINNTEYRILLVKIKNSVYIEFHLGDHKYYDKVRKELYLKK
jgi:hypothetical protein